MTASTREDFEWSYTDEPHRTRRQQILAKHPEVKSLFGPDPWLATKIGFVVSLQVIFAGVASTLEGLPFWLLTYCVGGTLNHSLTLGMHEISHNLAFRKLWLNRVTGMVCNMPLGIPAFAMFKRYHMDHHKYQGEDVVDADVPTAWEGRMFRGVFGKLIWMILQPVWYALRPIVVVPKAPTMQELYNWTGQIAFDLAIYAMFGWSGLIYLVMGTLLGMGLHPLAGHFVAEHYTFVKGQETYSYYGPLNWLSFNVGYHNEHHDFPFVAGSRLPELRAMAPEFYDNLPCHSSWVKVIYQYIMDPSIGPFARVKRSTLNTRERDEVCRR